MGLVRQILGLERDGASNAVPERRSIEDPRVPISAAYDDIMAFFGIVDRFNALPQVSIEAALQVPAVFSITNFLPRTLAALPLHTFEAGEGGERVDDGPSRLLSFAPNEEESSFAWRVYHWHQVFTGGRGLSWIERAGDRPVAVWPMDPSLTEIVRHNGRKIYRFDGKEYRPRDVIDTPFLLKRDRLGSYSPIAKCNKAISLAIAMTDFAGGFFAGGGVPPLALEGPIPEGPEAFKRAQADIRRAIEIAKQEHSNIFPMPPGHKLAPVGINPDESQMADARLFQVQEIGRVWQVPPVFVGDLSKGTFSNTEQQDIQLVKHLIAHWAKAFEDEITLKFHGWRNPRRRVKHNLDGLQRGVFKDRVEALARAIMTGQLMPDEARALENRGPDPNGHGAQLFMQGATVPLGTPPSQMGHNGGPPLEDEGDEGDDDAGDENDD